MAASSVSGAEDATRASAERARAASANRTMKTRRSNAL
jgi:hypothetical protein